MNKLNNEIEAIEQTECVLCDEVIRVGQKMGFCTECENPLCCNDICRECERAL